MITRKYEMLKFKTVYFERKSVILAKEANYFVIILDYILYWKRMKG